MKTFKRLACSVLALTMVLSLTACSSKSFNHKKMVKFSEDQDYEMFDDVDDYSESFGEIIIGNNPGDGAYMSATGKDAQEIYKYVFNRFDNFPSYDDEVTEATSVIFYDDDDTFVQFYLLTFEDSKYAEKLFKKYSKIYEDFDAEEGEEKEYSYCIYSTDIYGEDEYYGVYVKGNSFMYLQTMNDADELADEICKSYGIISPTEA